MQRIQEHRLNLGKVINDDRISGDNRLLAELVAMWLDCKIPRKGGQPKSSEEIAEAKQESSFLEGLITSRFMTKAGVLMRNIDKSDDLPIAKIERDASTVERAAIDSILGRG